MRLLMPLGDQRLAAGEISRALGLSSSRLSFYLAVLEQAGLIRARKLARHVFWSVDAAGMAAPISILLNDGCMEHPEEMASRRHGQTVAAPVIAPAAMTPTTAPQES